MDVEATLISLEIFWLIQEDACINVGVYKYLDSQKHEGKMAKIIIIE